MKIKCGGGSAGRRWIGVSRYRGRVLSLLSRRRIGAVLSRWWKIYSLNLIDVHLVHVVFHLHKKLWIRVVDDSRRKILVEIQIGGLVHLR